MFKIQSIYMNPARTDIITKGSAKVFRIYKNSNAEDLFVKAQCAKTVEERAKLFEQMGEYDIVTEPVKPFCRNRFMQFLRGLFNAC